MRAFWVMTSLWVGGCCMSGPSPDERAARLGVTDSAADAAPADAGPAYSYPGCSDAGDYGCAGSGAFTCALMAIEARYASCQSASDCVTARVENCIGVFHCPPAAVSDAGLSDFMREARLETARYCGAGCGSSGLCGTGYSAGLVECRAGRCAALPDDAGL